MRSSGTKFFVHLLTLSYWFQQNSCRLLVWYTTFARKRKKFGHQKIVPDLTLWERSLEEGTKKKLGWVPKNRISNQRTVYMQVSCAISSIYRHKSQILISRLLSYQKIVMQKMSAAIDVLLFFFLSFSNL